MDTETQGITPAEAAKTTESAPVTEMEDTTGEETGQENQADESGDLPKGKTPKWAEKRFAELTRQREEERRRAEKLEGMLHEMYTRQQQPQVPPQVQTAETPPKYEDFGDHDEFVRAVARYEAKQELRAESQRMEQARRQAEVQTRELSQIEKLDNIQTRGIAKHQDFESVAYVPKGLVPFVVNVDNAEDLAMHFGKNKREAEDLVRQVQVDPAGAAVKVGMIAARLAMPIPKATTQAPPPVTPVGGNAGADAEPDPAKDPEGWIKYERERVRKLGRRY